MSIQIEFDVDDEPFNKIPNLKEIRCEQHTSNFLQVSCVSSNCTSTSYIPVYSNSLNSNSSPDMDYIIELKDGAKFTLDRDDVLSLIGLLFNDIPFRDAIVAVNI